MSPRTELSPRAAALLAIVCLACSALPILGGLHVIRTRLTEGIPGWVAVASGSMFLLAAAALAIDALAGGIGKNGLRADAPAGLRAAQNVCGFGILVLIAVITTWMAVGKGARHFNLLLPLPLVSSALRDRDTLSRWAFGLTAALLWIVAILTGVDVLRRFFSARQRP